MDTKLIYGGDIITMCDDCKNPEAVVFDNERILYAGGFNEALERFPNSELTDLKGKTLCPGFIDTHSHLSFTSEIMTQPSIFDLDNLDDILSCLNEEAKKLNRDQVLFVNGFGGKAIRENRLPSLEEMDRAVPDIPVLCKEAGTHGTIVNTRGLELVQREAEKRKIHISDEDIRTGFLKDEANLLAFALVPMWMDKKQKLEAEKKMIDEVVKNGITLVHTFEGRQLRDDLDVANLVNAGESIPFDLRIYYQTTDVEEAKRLGLKTIGGCFSCILDGDVDPGTAAFRKPYTNNPDNYGRLYFSNEDLERFFIKANREEFQIGMHAIGDAAIEQALNAYEKALEDFPRADHRHRIEHFEIGDRDLIERAKELGIVLAMQPVFDYYWPYETYIPYIGRERAEKRCMLRDVIDSGITAGGGSDSPVCSMNPMLGIHQAVNHSVKSSRISVKEAMELYTVSASYMSFEEDIRGKIKKGFKPDFAVLSENPFKIDSDKIDRIEIMATVYNGEFVYKWR